MIKEASPWSNEEACEGRGVGIASRKLLTPNSTVRFYVRQRDRYLIFSSESGSLQSFSRATSRKSARRAFSPATPYQRPTTICRLLVSLASGRHFSSFGARSTTATNFRGVSPPHSVIRDVHSASSVISL